MKRLVEIAKPTSNAKFLRFETFNKPDMAAGQKPGLFTSYPWPYVEGITMAEAMNDLPLMVTGAYGKPLPKSMGAPLRLHLPWKYGFKSIKGIVRVSFTAERPVSFWETLGPQEYGFWANVNPEVPHPRWSQATEQVLGTGERVPTLLFNGYGEQVASLYAGLEAEKLLYVSVTKGEKAGHGDRPWSFPCPRDGADLQDASGEERGEDQHATLQGEGATFASCRVGHASESTECGQARRCGKLSTFMGAMPSPHDGDVARHSKLPLSEAVRRRSETPLLRLGDEEVAEHGDALGVLQFFRIDEIGVELRRLDRKVDLHQA